MRESNDPRVRVEDLQLHARSLAIELIGAGVVYDTLVRRKDDETLTEAWEVPSGSLPDPLPFVLGIDGLYTGRGPRVPGRQVKAIDEREVLPKGLEISVRHRLYAMEKKHDIFNKLKSRDPEENA